MLNKNENWKGLKYEEILKIEKVESYKGAPNQNLCKLHHGVSTYS